MSNIHNKQNTKVIAMYLPQFHEIPENNEWWGKGFTDWISVKNAIPLYLGHSQPKVPEKERYYNLLCNKTLQWQAKLVERSGIYGFAFYHYWFSSDKQLLEKPAEIVLHNMDISLRFCFSWDNASWIRTWSKYEGNAWTPKYDSLNKDKGKGKGVLVQYQLGEEDDWRKHFDYLLPFFKDNRYIKKNNCPLFMIINQLPKRGLKRMQLKWNEWAKEEGFSGIYFIGKHSNDGDGKLFKTEYLYEPVQSGWLKDGLASSLIELRYRYLDQKKRPKRYFYDYIWTKILIHALKNKDTNIYYGAFVNYDDTPRRAVKGKVVVGGTPRKFLFYMKHLLQISNKQGKDYIFLTAWNEWGEGAYLEPDKKSRYSYIDALSRLLK